MPVGSSWILGTLQIGVRAAGGWNVVQHLDLFSVYFDVCWRGAIGWVARVGTTDVHKLDDHVRSTTLGPERNAYVLHAVPYKGQR